MNICILGDGLTALALSKSLINKKLNVSMYYEKEEHFKDFSTRTIGISKDNFDYFNKDILKFKNSMFWEIKKIDIYSETSKEEKIIEFEKSGNTLFYILKNQLICNLLNAELKKNYLFNKKKVKSSNFYKKILKEKKFDLIINCDNKNVISKELLNKKILKDYNSSAYTTLIKHKKTNNNKAIQIFTKSGPIAFLPISDIETSIVFSKLDSKSNFDLKELEAIIHNYKLKFKIKSISQINKFPLHFSLARIYHKKNIMLFGDMLHRIHPHAGQGFNMTVRDIKILNNIINEHLSLGLQIDSQIFEKFETRVKHFNLLFSSGIDFIYEFFKINNNLSNKIVKFFGSNKHLKKYLTKYADQGIYF